MNRHEEYQALLMELEQTPAALDDTVARAVKRKTKFRRMYRAFSIPVGSFAACFLGFMLLVNLFPPFAHACGTVPFFKVLAQAVAWSPSLSAAVENDYVQSIEESQTKDGITATVHYIIGDRQELNIFYSLQYDKALEGRVYAEYQMEGSSGTAGSMVEKPGELEQINRDFMNCDIPDTTELTITVYLYPERDALAPPECTVEEAMFDENIEENRIKTATFTFCLKIDAYFIEQEEIIPVNQSFQIEGQTLTLNQVEIYPTCLRLEVESDEGNTLLLNSLDLYVENERGELFGSRGRGLYSSGGSDDRVMNFWLDSPFFSNSNQLTLYIQRVEWKNQETSKVRVDLKDGHCDPLPPDTYFGGAENFEAGWIVNFVHPYQKENTMYHVFGHTFWDEEGTEYEINSFSSTIGYEDMETGERLGEEEYFTESFPLKYFDEDVVYLNANYNQVTELETPLSVPIK